RTANPAATEVAFRRVRPSSGGPGPYRFGQPAHRRRDPMTPRILQAENLLAGKTVFLSASTPTRQPDLFPPAAEDEIEESVRSLARAVFAEGGHLVLGAHPSISPLIVDVATEYFPPSWGQAGDQ